VCFIVNGRKRPINRHVLDRNTKNHFCINDLAYFETVRTRQLTIKHTREA
jgi:hypothetical protein